MTDKLTELTVEIVSGFVTGNKVSAGDLPKLIQSVRQTLMDIDAPPLPEPAATIKATPAQIRKSITPDHLISFEDGKPYKTLKRHLGTRGMTLAEYREKWGLASDYPAAAPNYSAQRSQMAKALGLGRKAAPAAEAPPPKKPRARKAAAK